jgi:uncharacterized membrane protein YfcA
MPAGRTLKLSLLAVLAALCLCAMCNPVLSFHDADMDWDGARHIPAFVTLVLGFVVGCYGTIVGIGGGPLIVPVLMLFYDWPAEDIVASSLFVVCLNALSGTLGYATQRRIDYRGGVAFSLAALPGAVLSSFIHHLLDIRIFDHIFGLFLVALAGFTLFKVSRGERALQRRPSRPELRRVVIFDRFRQRHVFHCDDALGISSNFFLGFLAGFLGIGGGVFQVPLLVFVLGFPTHIATATSHFVTMLTSAFALAPNVALGNVHFAETGWLGFGVVVGAQAGAKAARRLRSRAILYLFSGILAVLAAKLLSS